MGPIAGLAAGIGLAALFTHLGWGEGLANFVMLMLLALIAVVTIRWVLRRFAGGSTARERAPFAMAGAGATSSQTLRTPLHPQPQPAAAAAPQIATTASTASPSTLPADFRGNNSTAEVVVHPSGQFVYGSNRGHDSIAGFAVEPDGTLKPIGHEPTQGRTPRNFNIDPTGAYLIAANQGSNNLVVFRIDPQSGKLTPTGHRAEVASPVCVKFLAAQR